MLNYIILGLLNYRPMTGYDIKRLMASSTEHFWDAKLSQIYATLKKLEQSGAIQSHIEAQEDRPDRRVYIITEAGKADLKAWQAKMIVNRETKKDPLLLKIFFASPEDDKSHLLSQLRYQLDLHREQLRLYEQDSPQVMVDFVGEQSELAVHIPLWELTRRFGVMYEETYIRWLEDAIQTLEET